MNIIKFIDTPVAGKTWYNNNIRGKYTYWIHCKFVVSFDNELNYYDVEKLSDDDIILYFNENNIIFLNTDSTDEWVLAYVDESSTALANSISKFIKANSFIPDDDITLDELKKFRSWLAENMLDMGDWDDNSKHILEYYKNDMSDDVVKWLNYFGASEIGIYSSAISSVCGCSGNGNLSSLYNDSLINCDPLSVYRKNIKSGMIDLFSNVDSWKELPKEFLDEIIKYLQGIIKANLPLVSESDTLDIYSCKCLSDGNLAQTQAQKILSDLIDVFTWIKNDEISGHKNNIYTVLTNWSTNLYEKMKWN